MGKRILVFDSGLGGLTVARALRRLAPSDVRIDYAADFAGFPYGDWEEDALREHLVALMGRLIERARPDIVVIACNTASTLALEDMRKNFWPLPFVGTVPAIKPAAHLSESRIIGVLATPGTVRREYTERLIHTFAYHCRVVLHGAKNLAALAEEKLRGGAVDMALLREEIAPAFVVGADGARTDVVVLGCTHYPLLLPELEEAAPWPVKFIDPADAIARQALRVAGLSWQVEDVDGAWPAAETAERGGSAYLTGMAAGWSPQGLEILFAREGFGVMAPLDAAGGLA